MIRILGIDPGSRITGYGVIECRSERIQHVGSGSIKLPTGDLPGRLSEIYHQITDVICKYEPQIAVVEQVFVSVNPQSALLLGHARGSAIVACAASELEIYEYAARQIKKSITGSGSAAKEQIQYMVQMLLSLKKMPDPDEADALAGAITHYQHMPILDPVLRSHRRKTPLQRIAPVT
jgi:crossover junction endodeoxyribonuclease RuvC